MVNAYWSGETSRRIRSRIIVEGDLVLLTPAHLGNGDTDEQVDMSLLTDALDGRTPLLTGASIAGALRAYLAARQHGSRQEPPGEAAASASVLLFGGSRGDDEGEQSLLIVEDAPGRPDAQREGAPVGIEVREGVRIEPTSRTAEEKKLYNFELWEAGTTFPLRFELIVRADDDAAQLKSALATALQGLQEGEITLGARKTRGLGKVIVENWRVKEYVLSEPDDLLEWVLHGAESLEGRVPSVEDIASALNASLLKDARRVFVLEAVFAIDGSLLIRADSGMDDIGPDTRHLHTRQGGKEANIHEPERPVVSGTSLAGALRARALRIALALEIPNSISLVNAIFGPMIKPKVKPNASRLCVKEQFVEGVESSLVQNRVSIDRFTGGARDTALFNEQPVFGGKSSQLKIILRLAYREVKEIGLLLLLLKDLWTGDLPLGGESGIGRGRLKGISAHLHLQTPDSGAGWEIKWQGSPANLSADERRTLEGYVAALRALSQAGGGV